MNDQGWYELQGYTNHMRHRSRPLPAEPTYSPNAVGFCDSGSKPPSHSAEWSPPGNEKVERNICREDKVCMHTSNGATAHAACMGDLNLIA